MSWCALGAVAAQVGCSGDKSIPVTTAEARGEILFTSTRCATCHGADANGIPEFPGGPRIIGRPIEDLITQLREPCADPTAVSGCHPLKVPDLTNAQLSDIAAYLAFLGQLPTDEDPGPVCTDIAGSICTVAGNGIPGNRRGTTLARAQNLFWPQNTSMDPEGRLIITDWNNYLIRRMDPTDCQRVNDQTGGVGMDCNLVNIIGTSGLGDTCSTAATPVAATAALMNHPIGADYDAAGNIVLQGWHQWKIKYIPVNPDGTTGNMFCLFGNGRGAGMDGVPAGFNVDGAGGPTRFNLPSVALTDRDGNWYIADQGNVRIRMVTRDASDPVPTPGMDAAAYVQAYQDNPIVTIAGGLLDDTGAFRLTRSDYTDSGDGGPAAMATFNVQNGFDALPQFRIALDRDTNLLYVADSENHRIRVIDLNTPERTINTLIGGGTDINGTTASTVQLAAPADVDLVPEHPGDLLITDTFNHCIRYYTAATQAVAVIAGVCGQQGYGGDGGPATGAMFAEPGGASITADGTLYVADTLNHRIRRVVQAIPQ